MGGQYIDPVSALRPATRAALPSLCAVCHGWGRSRLCAVCVARFGGPVARCQRCAIAVPDGVSVCGACLADAPPQQHAVAAVDYAFPWDRLVAQFKFAGAVDLAPALAGHLADAVLASAQPLPDLVVPAPLAPARLAERGYNQAWELARRVARRLQLAADPALLLRVRETPHQLDLPRAERAGNVRGAFAVEPLRRAALRDRRVAVVDDVMTSGATAAEMARVLLGSGAAAVHVWVVARTPAPGGA
jgi:ComF family protein